MNKKSLYHGLFHKHLGTKTVVISNKNDKNINSTYYLDNYIHVVHHLYFKHFSRKSHIKWILNSGFIITCSSIY